MPAPEFFGVPPGQLRWNGGNGWTDQTGLQVATVRHVGNGGMNELLVDTDWLERWLAAQQKSLVWVENSGKDVYGGLGDDNGFPGRHTRSQVHSWSPGEDLQTAEPGWNQIPARTS